MAESKDDGSLILAVERLRRVRAGEPLDQAYRAAHGAYGHRKDLERIADAYLGVPIRAGEGKCPRCKGHGFAAYYAATGGHGTCFECNGTGNVWRNIRPDTETDNAETGSGGNAGRPRPHAG